MAYYESFSSLLGNISGQGYMLYRHYWILLNF